MRRLLNILLVLMPSLAFCQLDSSQLNIAPVYTDLQKALEHPSDVYRLNLSRKRLKVFPMEILKFPNLQELDLSKNRLDSLPEQIGLLQHLQILNVSGNKLQYLPDSIGELKNLRKLVGSRNSLQLLPRSIGRLTNLEVLDLWENDIANFPEELGNLKKLRWMDLRVIMVDDKEQERIKQLLPDAKIFFSPSCHCVTG